jgi:copper chaperone CopZ
MNPFLKLMISAPALLLNTACNGQIKNATSVTVKIAGNCGMCEETIEKAANVKHTASLEWNKDTKTATLSYDPNKTTPDEVLKRVAYAGYDNEKFLAPDATYKALPSCCQYERKGKKLSKEMAGTDKKSPASDQIAAGTDSGNSFKTAYDAYFDLKNALINTDASAAASKASALAQALSNVDMNKLKSDEHSVWMNVYKNLIATSESISKSKDIEQQRKQFMSLSEQMHELMKVAKPDAPVYYQHCPMYNDGKGANWLSMESSIKNPYYGSQMMTCGKTIETIK